MAKVLSGFCVTIETKALRGEGHPLGSAIWR
jgi:hypothetical protein